MEGTFSLADLAATNTDEIAVLTSRLPEPGIFTVRGTEVGAKEVGNDPNKPKLVQFGFKAEILEAEPHDKLVDKEKLIGRTLSEGYTLWPENLAESIGLLKGRYMLVGLPNTGRMGGVEGEEPGWLDGIVNHIYKIRVRRYTNKNGQEQAGFDWLKVEQAEESAAA